jgi:hypothetical protein
MLRLLSVHGRFDTLRRGGGTSECDPSRASVAVSSSSEQLADHVIEELGALREGPLRTGEEI